MLCKHTRERATPCSRPHPLHTATPSQSLLPTPKPKQRDRFVNYFDRLLPGGKYLSDPVTCYGHSVRAKQNQTERVFFLSFLTHTHARARALREKERERAKKKTEHNRNETGLQPVASVLCVCVCVFVGACARAHTHTHREALRHRRRVYQQQRRQKQPPRHPHPLKARLGLKVRKMTYRNDSYVFQKNKS